MEKGLIKAEQEEARQLMREPKSRYEQQGDIKPLQREMDAFDRKVLCS